MRTWLATAAFISRRMATKFSAVVALLTVSAAAALAQPAGEARAGKLRSNCPTCRRSAFSMAPSTATSCC